VPSRRINNFPESRRGLGHVTLTIFGSTVGYPSDSLASCPISSTISNCLHLRYSLYACTPPSTLHRQTCWLS